MQIKSDGTIVGLAAGGLPNSSVVQGDLAAGVAGTGPAFSAQQNAAQAIPASTPTVVLYQAKEFDTTNAFDVATGKFQPTVAGYYLLHGTAMKKGAAAEVLGLILKNGSTYARGTYGTGYAASATALVYLNGTTDYVQYQAFWSTAADTQEGSTTTFHGFLARAA